MKLLLSLVSASSHMSGVQRHALDLAAALMNHGDVEELHLAASPWQRDLVYDYLPRTARLYLHLAEIGHSALDRNRWYYRDLPRMAAATNVELVHLTHPMPVRRSAMPRTVVTLHDLYPFDVPENFTFPHVLVNQIVLRQCLRSVDAIGCVSQTTMTRLQERLPTYANKAVVVPNIVREFPLVSSSKQRKNPYVLCVAQHRANKNVLLALDVFRALLFRSEIAPLTRFVLVGIPGPETQRIKQTVARLGLAEHVDFLAGISDSELSALYRDCELVLAPSKAEGFGLPVVEALQHGARVICSDIPAFREFGGDYCTFVSLSGGATEAFVRAARQTLQRPRRAPVSFPALSPEAVCQRWMALYRSLLESTATAPALSTADAAIKKGLPLL